jgi:hypothetical protein
MTTCFNNDARLCTSERESTDNCRGRNSCVTINVVLEPRPPSVMFLVFPLACNTRIFVTANNIISWSQWQRGRRRRFGAPRLLISWVRIPPGAWMFVCCECCVLSGRGLCDELITHPEESYRMWCVVVCDLENSRMRRPWPALGRSTTKNK